MQISSPVMFRGVTVVPKQQNYASPIASSFYSQAVDSVCLSNKSAIKTVSSTVRFGRSTQSHQYAASGNKLGLISRLWANPRELHEQDENGDTPLHIGVNNSSVEIVRYLLSLTNKRVANHQYLDIRASLALRNHLTPENPVFDGETPEELAKSLLDYDPMDADKKEIVNLFRERRGEERIP